jgi:MoaA/NifB/PqqE/SkfB family radical SAM enzyme
MDFIRGSKIEFYRERIKYDRRPITADVFLTDFCQLNCSYCRFRSGSEWMNLDLFKAVFEKLRCLNVRGIILSGGGEPLLNPHIEKIIKYLDAHAFPWAINTNFVSPVIDFEMRPRFVKISVDASSRAEYAKKRGADKFIEVVARIREFSRVKNKNTALGVQAVITQDGQARSFYEFFKNQPVDYISFRPLEIRMDVDRRRGLFRGLIDLVGLPKASVSYKWDHINRRYSRCYMNWSVISVNQRAEVLYCCNKPDEIVGSIFEPEILKMRREFKTDMSACEVPCRLSGINDAAFHDDGDRIHSEFI